MTDILSIMAIGVSLLALLISWQAAYPARMQRRENKEHAKKEKEVGGPISSETARRLKGRNGTV